MILCKGTRIVDRPYGKFLEEGRTFITLADAKAFINDNDENDTRRPLMIYRDWADVNHMTLINMARSAALWQSPEAEFITSDMDRNTVIKLIHDTLFANGMTNSLKGLLFLTDFSSTILSAIMASPVQLQLQLNNTLAEIAIMSGSHHLVAVWVDDCIVQKYYANRNVRQVLPVEEPSSEISQNDEQVFKEEFQDDLNVTFEQNIFRLKIMQNEVRELANNMSNVKEEVQKE